MIILNSDKKLVDEIREKLLERHGYCPCALVQNEDTKCMCKAFKEQKSGMCPCGLYIKTED